MRTRTIYVQGSSSEIFRFQTPKITNLLIKRKRRKIPLYILTMVSSN